MDSASKALNPTYKLPTKIRHPGTSPSAIPLLQLIGNPVYHGYELWELISNVFAKLRFTRRATIYAQPGTDLGHQP